MEVDDAHFIIYRVVIPFFIAVGILVNGLAILVLSRPRLRSARVSRYFLLLVASDLGVCFFYIPVSTTVTGCVFTSYGEAFYYAHFCWTLVGFSQGVGTYIIVWLALDRFMAVWMYHLYPGLQKKPHVLRNRIVGTVLTCFLVHLTYMIKADVVCSNDDEDTCADGMWVGITGYEYEFDRTWHKVYRAFFGLYVRWVPSVLMVIFNVGMVIGVVRGRIRHPTTQGRTSGRSERKLILTMIAITASYIVLTLPITLYIMAFATPTEDRCSGRHPQEVLRGVGNAMQLFEHIFHIVFLAILNKGFRREVKIILGVEEEPPAGAPHCGLESRSNISVSPRVVETAISGGQQYLAVPHIKHNEAVRNTMIDVLS